MKVIDKIKGMNTNDRYWHAGPYDQPPWSTRMAVRPMNSIRSTSRAPKIDQASDSPSKQLPKTSMKKPSIQNIKIAAKEERCATYRG